MAVYAKRKIVLSLIMSKKRENTSFRLKSEKFEKKIKEMISFRMNWNVGIFGMF